MERTPQYYRARLDAIYQVAKQNPPDRFKKNSDAGLLRYGVIAGTMAKPIENIIELSLNNHSTKPLRFSEISRFNTWFELYPEKICGQEYVSTSMQFPIMIKGSEQDIITTISVGMDKKTVSRIDDAMRIRITEAEAEAMILILEQEKTETNIVKN